MKKYFKRISLLIFLAAFASGALAAEFNETTRLAVLAKVWGFLKYYHPEVAKGEINWDLALYPVIAKAKTAGSREDFGAVLNELFQTAGNVNFLNYSRLVPREENTDPLFAWMKDDTHIGTDIRMKMEILIENMAITSNAYFKDVFPGGNLNFGGDSLYTEAVLPNEDQRLLALFRYWNIIQYFFPYKGLISAPWEDVLLEFIPRVRQATGLREYTLVMRALAARIEDCHAFMYSDDLDEFWGLYYPPFAVGYFEGQTIVTEVYGFLPDSSPGGLAVGDLILSADGIPIADLRSSRANYVQASNEPALQRNLDRLIFRGSDKSLHLTVDRFGQVLGIDVVRCYYSQYSIPAKTDPVWGILDGNIGYVDMGRLLPAQVTQMMNELMTTEAIIFDIRNYPNGTMYAIALRLNYEATPFAKFTEPDNAHPGHFLWTNPYSAGPSIKNPNHYPGQVVLLVNETTQSHAEFTTMALQTAPRCVTIGSQTAGADGNVSTVWLPGNIRTLFSGIGVYYPDGSETQKVGVRVDLLVRPTIAGIRAGRDEVLEKALEFLKEGRR